jgi:hypothetical protein
MKSGRTRGSPDFLLLNLQELGKRRNMKWRVKALLHRAIDVAPYGEALHLAVQRHVTRSLPRRLADYPRHLEESRQQWRAFNAVPGATGRLYFEFGAGWDLFHNLYLYCMGLERQLVIDLYPHLHVDLVNNVISNFRRMPPPGAVRAPARELTAAIVPELEAHYGISYLAPCDARAVGGPDQSIGLAGTINTLEHIPFETLPPILRELRRLASPDALIYMQVDYSDHYSHSDPTITPYNFLRFDEAAWERYNAASHYQNRRRHPDYRALFLRHGFEIVEERTIRPPQWQSLLSSTPLAEPFRQLDPEQTAVTCGIFVIRPELSVRAGGS